MTILTILGVMEILGSFRLVLNRKTGKKISESSRLKFLEKFLGNNFALSDAKVNKCGNFKNLFATITGLSELNFRFRKFTLFIQMKKSYIYELWQQHK